MNGFTQTHAASGHHIGRALAVRVSAMALLSLVVLFGSLLAVKAIGGSGLAADPPAGHAVTKPGNEALVLPAAPAPAPASHPADREQRPAGARSGAAPSAASSTAAAGPGAGSAATPGTGAGPSAAAE